MPQLPRYLFVTGKLAAPSLRRVLADLTRSKSFEAEVAVLPITVAALLTTDWIARHLAIPEHIERILLPGYCRGPLEALQVAAGVEVQRGPNDLRDLPEFFGDKKSAREGYGKYDIEILAEINHAPELSHQEILQLARRYRDGGADVIDLGCDPGDDWKGVGDAVSLLRDEGFRVSIDSFNPTEVTDALARGAELVLSVNSTNLEHVRRWHESFPGIEVVAIPDIPSDLDGLNRTVQALVSAGVRFRIDPIIEPIGFGFAASLGRFIDTRKRYPTAEIMMGVGNLTELTDVDSAGINVLLAGFCQELGVRSVLTTEVINWCSSSVREFDLARRLVFHAIHGNVLPKNLEPRLIMLRDPKRYEHGVAGLQELAGQVTDRNYRIFVERGEIHVLNGSIYLHGTDPFLMLEEMRVNDARLDVSHAFYLGYELSKAVTALTLNKNYIQDQALSWGFLTVPEISHRSK